MPGLKIAPFADPGAVSQNGGGGTGGGGTGGGTGGGFGSLQGTPVSTDEPTEGDVLTVIDGIWTGAPPTPGGGPIDAEDVTYDPSTSGLSATDVQAALDELAAMGVDTEGLAYTVETQNPQTRHYLMRDGTWRDPLLSGTGELTVGSIATITDDSKYNAWPTLCRMRDGRLLLAYTKGDSHHADTTGNAKGKIGTEGLNGAISWGTEFTIYDHATLWATVQAIASTSTGRLFATLWRDNPASAGSGEAGLVYSDDYGTTWSAWISLTAAFSQESFGAGPVIELGNGDLLVTIEGTDSGTLANRSSRTMRSTNQGVTWGSVVTIRAYATDSRPYYETRLLLLDNDTILAFHRCSAGASPGTNYMSTSTNGGTSWGAPVQIFDGYGSPNVIQLSTGTLFATTRRNSNASTIAYTSTDRGASWSALVVLDATMTEMEYACGVELFDGRVYVVEGFQPSGATTNSDIKGIYVTETTTSSTGSVDLTDGTTTVAGATNITLPPGSLSGSSPNATLAYLTPTLGGQGTVNVIASSGSAQTLDLADGNAVEMTLDDDCAVDFDGFTAGKDCWLYVETTQDGTGGWLIGWDTPVVWQGGVDPTPDTSPGAVEAYVFRSSDGGTTILGWFGGAGTATSTSTVTDHEHITNVQFSGDGSTTAFELPAAPFDAFSVMAYVAGVRTDVTLSGVMLTTMTFGAAPASASNNIIVDIIAAVA